MYRVHYLTVGSACRLFKLAPVQVPLNSRHKTIQSAKTSSTMSCCANDFLLQNPANGKSGGGNGGCPEEDDKRFLSVAIAEAKQGLKEGGIPIGSCIVHKGKVLGAGHNRRVQKGSVILHGEMDALENAGRYPAKVYQESTLYTTLSPCSMCTGAILLYGIPRVVIGENKTFMGEEDLLRSKGVQVTVLQDEECMTMMKNFIRDSPKLWAEDIGEVFDGKEKASL